jgi:hypothetical protein
MQPILTSWYKAVNGAEPSSSVMLPWLSIQL